MKLIERLKDSKHYDKFLHLVGGGVVALAYYAVVFLTALYAIVTEHLGLMVMFQVVPLGLFGLLVCAFVHASKEANDYLAMRRGENYTPSFLDFLAGMAGSFVVLWTLL